jgi:hypothetical protein
MTEFMFVFRRDTSLSAERPSPEQYQGIMKQWQDWIGSLAAQNKLVATGRQLEHDGKVVRGDKTVTNGPYVEVKEVLGGYMFVRATDINEAAELAKGCPILVSGGTVEIRPFMATPENH